MIQLWRDLITYTKRIIHDESGDLVKMFSAPKSKSPWAAMTSGASGKGLMGAVNRWIDPLGGLFGGIKEMGPKGKLSWAGPIGTMAVGAIPYVGPALAGLGGAMGTMEAWSPGSGYQGSDKGWSNVGSTAGGALAGYGAGGVGRGIGAGIGAAAGGGTTAGGSSAVGNLFVEGFGEGASTYGLGSAGAQQLMGGGGGGGVAGATGGGAAGAAGAGGLTMQNLTARTLGGAAMLGASAMMKPPTIGTRPDIARQATEMPNLVEARGMIRDLAMMNPSELVGPASDEYMEATLRQTRQAHQYQRQQAINDFAAQGKTIGKSGAVNERLARMDESQAQRESDFITTTNEARYIAGIKTKIQSVTNYFNISEREAADMLASYGYISPDDLLNYNSALASYTGMQQAMGQMGGMMMGQ